MNEPLLTIKEVARHFAVSTQTVARWEKRGELRSVRIGGSVRFTQKDIADFISIAQRERDAVTA